MTLKDWRRQNPTFSRRDASPSAHLSQLCQDCKFRRKRPETWRLWGLRVSLEVARRGFAESSSQRASTHAADFTYTRCSTNEGPMCGSHPPPPPPPPPTPHPLLQWRVSRKSKFPWNRSKMWVWILFLFTRTLSVNYKDHKPSSFLHQTCFSYKKKTVSENCLYRYGAKTHRNSLLSVGSSRSDRMSWLFGAVHGSDPPRHYQPTRIHPQLRRRLDPETHQISPPVRVTLSLRLMMRLDFGTSGENLHRHLSLFFFFAALNNHNSKILRKNGNVSKKMKKKYISVRFFLRLFAWLPASHNTFFHPLTQFMTLIFVNDVQNSE